MKGVYAIVDVKTNKYYIGSSKNIHGRWIGHRTTLKRNCHANKYLQRIYNKRGQEALFYVVLEYCDNYLDVEQRYIDEMFLQGRCLNGRREAKPGGTRRGQKNTPEHNRKISLAQKGKPRTHKKRVYTDEDRKKLSEWMKERHRKGLVNTGHNQHTKKKALKNKQ